jgi:ribosomal protein S18 acetylase RimI-like enzyme
MVKAILREASDAELSKAVEENLFDLFRTMAQYLKGGELSESAGLSKHLAFPFNPMFKGVWQTRLNEETVEQGIQETIAWFEERGAPFFFWWTGAETSPEDLGNRLMAHGMASMEAFAAGIRSTSVGAPCMVANLAQMNDAAVQQVPENFVIEIVQDEAGLLAFKDVFVESYEIPEWAGQAWVDASLAIGVEKTPWRVYVGKLDGKPVACNILFNGGGVSSVYGVATIPEARGKGIGGAITLKPFLDAREMGYHYAVLFASEMGIHTYERIGFRLTENRVNRYLWRKSS